MFLRLVKQMAECESVTEKLKAENQPEWIGRMNNIRACVREVVYYHAVEIGHLWIKLRKLKFFRGRKITAIMI